MKVVCISDTHEQHRSLTIPDGDLLIHAGDLTYSGDVHVAFDFIRWFESLPHKHKIFIAGNHDFCFEGRLLVLFKGYLKDHSTRCGGLKIFGSPYTPNFGSWAFMKARGEELREVWNQIPVDTDILVTHGPPYGIGDLTPPEYGSVHAGCSDLLETVQRIKPKLHVFGHIHNGYGVTEKDGTIFVNASTCTEDYEATNALVVVEI